VAGAGADSGIVVVPPGGGVRTGNVEFLALSKHTPRFTACLITIAPRRHGPPAHFHRAEDDAFFILEGELTFAGGEGEEPIAAPAGTFVLVPPGVPHTFFNATDEPVRIFNVHAPAGFDRRLLGD